MDGLSPAKLIISHKMQLMGIAEFIIGPVEDRTRWPNPSYALFVPRGSLHALQPGRGFARNQTMNGSKGIHCMVAKSVVHG